MSKAQATFEFIVVLLITAAFFSVVYMLIISERNNINRTAEDKSIEDLGYAIQQEFFVDASMNPGFERNITIPERISGKDYTISVLNNTLYLQQGETEIFLALPAVRGNLAPGRTYRITLDEGEVVING